MKKLLSVLLASTYASSFAIGTAASSSLVLTGSLVNSCISSFSNGGAVTFSNFTYGVVATASSFYQLICNPTATITSIMVTSANNGVLTNGVDVISYVVDANVSGGAPGNSFINNWTPTSTPVMVNTGPVVFESNATILTAELLFTTPAISSSLPAGNYDDTYSINANY